MGDVVATVEEVEIFSFQDDGMDLAWDVSRAARLIVARGDDQEDAWVEVAPLALAYLGHDGRGGVSGEMGINPVKALDRAVVDVRVPLIAAILPNGRALVIDGWHRVFQAWKRGIMALPCYVLDQQEEAACRVALG